MRTAFTIILAILTIALLYCANVARKSGKDMGKPVMHMLLALIPPIVGNLIIIASSDKLISTVGYYTYFLGMDLVVMVLLQFSMVYCDVKCNRKVSMLVLLMILVDAAQILTNPLHGQTFATEMIMAYGAPYYRLIPFIGQTFHRVLDYSIIGAVLVMFVNKIRKAPRVYSERYIVILAVMVVTVIWETLYIFSRTPVDRSMTGFGVFGLLVFYFSLYYKPMLLLDRLLAAVASEVPDALYCFDLNGKCIWVNKRGTELTGETTKLDDAAAKLESMLGSFDGVSDDMPEQRTAGEGENEKSYILERRTVNDDRGNFVGSFLIVRDNTTEQNTLRHEIYNATHDALTQLYNRAGYDLLVKNLDQQSTMMLLIDLDRFKKVNDEHGHHVGDLVLQKVARTIVRYFRSEDYICRVGGDEFVILMTKADLSQYKLLEMRVAAINKALTDTSDGLPPITISAGVAYGDKNMDPDELFDRADRALYNTKREGRSGITLFDKEKEERDIIEQGHIS